MRYSRIFTAFILASALIFALAFSVNAGAVETPLFLYQTCLDYVRTSGTGTSPLYIDLHPTQNDTGVFITEGITKTLTQNDSEYNLSTISFVLYPETDGYLVKFDLGYIYTFNFQIKTRKIDDFTNLRFEFGLSNDGVGLYTDLSSVNYTYTREGLYTIINVTSVVDVTENFSMGSLDNTPEEEIYYCLRMNCKDVYVDGTIQMQNIKQSVTKAIGEDAYYQASLDAITNLPESEYGFIYNSMPDSEGEIDVIQGQLLDVLQAYDPGIQQLVQVLRTSQARPCVYLPEVHIPFVDVHLWDNHIFYIDDYLNGMNTQIMTYIDTFLVFIRLVFFITFATFTIYKISRIEWWY